jgi:hypothetical protein
VVASILADVRTEAVNANTNFGTSHLSADADSVKNTFIRVSVSGLSGAPASAILKLTVASDSRAASVTGGRIRRIADCGWDEGTVTFNNQPSLTPVGAVGPAQGPVSPGQMVEFDVTSLVPGNGTFCFALTSDSSDGVDYNSREAASGQPMLLINGGGAPPTTTTVPPPTTTTVPPPTTTTVPPPTTTTTLPPAGVVTSIVADVRTEAVNPNTNFGTSQTLSVDADSEKNTFIEVSVSGLLGPPSSARIVLTVPDQNRAESNNGGSIHPIGCESWDELATTFTTQPVLPAPGPGVGPVARGALVEFDVTAHVAGNGNHCFVIRSPSSDGADYNSREAATGQPQFIVVP